MKNEILTKALTLFILLTILGGCKGSGLNANDVNFGQAQGGQSKDMTDTGSCVGSPPANSTIFGSWSYSTQNNQHNEREDVTVTVQHTSMTATAVCTESGTSHTISATVPCTVTASSIRTASNDTEEINITPQCIVSIPQGTLSYTLVGNCAVIKINGHTTTMVRSGL